ncbi:MAG: efflux transporter outer membrane subunit [Legionella sp.]|nr:efflux transporter outer membrane subunit [Legionella sp.]
MITLNRLKRGAGLTLLSLLLPACMVGPNYVRPPVVGAPEFKEAKGKMAAGPISKNWKPIKPQDDMDRGEWWLVFNDPVLNDLEQQLNKYNQNIATTQATYLQSLAIVDQARASFFPTLTSAFNIFRQRQGGGATSFISTSGGTTSVGTATTGTQSTAKTATNYSGILNATWEPDIWGLVRRTVEADSAAAQSNAALIRVTRLSAQGALAQYYFELRTLDKNQIFLANTVTSYNKILTLTRNQYKAGVAALADVVQARSQLESAQASALNNGILRGQYEHAIAVLIGRPPAYLSLQNMPLRAKPPTIPLSVPSIWLERRPDIAQAERLMQNASALIGVATAAYYPNLSLTGSTSAAGNSFHKLIHTPSIGWSAGLQVAETIFDGGLRAATVRAAKEGYWAQVAAYRQVVLTAFQDVEDNLVALRILREQSVVQNKAAASARLALKLVVNQYKAGTVNYASVLTAQIAAFSAEQTANNVDGLQMTAAVGLIKSLGGGWVRRPELDDSSQN